MSVSIIERGFRFLPGNSIQYSQQKLFIYPPPLFLTPPPSVLHCHFRVTAKYPAICSYTPEKAGYMDTQLSPGNALRMRNTYMSYLRSCQDLLSPLEYASREKSGYAAMQLSRPPLSLGVC